MSVLSPFLNVGMSLVIFSSSGNRPFLNEEFMRLVKGLMED